VTVKRSMAIVIDANIAQAAGSKQTGDSKACRDFLDEVRKVCHRMVMTPAITQEWDKHQSSFALRWRTSMQSKKKLVFFKSDPRNEELRILVENSGALQNEGEREHLRKDCHLIEAALVTEFRIASSDMHARGLFSRLCNEFADLRRIIWTNPCIESEPVIMWLRAGAKDDLAQCLGYGEV
jgi:hypothetical protein